MTSRALLPLALCLLAVSAPAQTPVQNPVQTKAPKPAKSPNFIDPAHLDLIPTIPPPPATPAAELAELHRIESTRTPAQVAAAQKDDATEDIFLYATVLGPAFNGQSLPLTRQLSHQLRNDVSIANGPLKAHFARPRPYNFDPTLHSVCPTNKEFSYPSGHSFNGYLYGLTLAEIVPEQSAAILARADDYAHNRVICEAHYPSDTEASRRAAYVLFGAMLTNPAFQSQLAAARKEVRTTLHLD